MKISKEPMKTHRAEGIAVKMYTREEDVEKHVLKGRVILDSEDKTLLFAQSEKRTRYSKEVMRTDHGRLVRRPDGLYTLSFSMLEATERNLREVLLSELRNAAATMKKDYEKQLRRKKEEEKNV